MRESKTIKWTCTDSDTNQFGRKIKDKIYEFKQPDINDGEPVTIDLDRYTNEAIEDCIASYGYTIFPHTANDAGVYTRNVYDIYGEDGDWIIAECLFEMEEKPNKWL